MQLYEVERLDAAGGEAAAPGARSATAWAGFEARGSDRRLDFTRPFLPESLVEAEALPFLSPIERLTLNHIRSHSYLYLLQVVKERILPPVLEKAQSLLGEDLFRAEALDRLGRAEAQHASRLLDLREEFARGFGSPCAVIGPPEELARAVLTRHPLAAALALHHVAWLSERHYAEAVRDPRGADPRFMSAMRPWWRSQALPDRGDTMMLAALAQAGSPLESARAVDDYLALCDLTAAGLDQQVRFDLESLVRATGCELEAPQRDAFLTVERRATRRTWVDAAVHHPGFLASLERLGRAARERVERAAGAHYGGIELG